MREKFKTTTKPWFSRLLRHPARKRSGYILGHKTHTKFTHLLSPDTHRGGPYWRCSYSLNLSKRSREKMSIQRYLVHISFVVYRCGPAVVRCWTARQQAAARHCTRDAHSWHISPSQQSSAAAVSEALCERQRAHSFHGHQTLFCNNSSDNSNNNNNSNNNHNNNILNFILY